MHKCLPLLLLLITGFYNPVFRAQEILKGKIVDETNLGIPMADIYVKNAPELRTRADVEGNYLMRLQEGEYYMVYDAPGFEPREVFVVVNQGENIKNMQLFPINIKELESFEYSVKKTNPGRDIIMKVVEIKDSLDFNQYPYRCDVYIKAKDNRELSPEKEEKEEDEEIRSIEELKEEKLGQLNNMNMVEVELQRNYAPPNNVREIRNAYSKRGSDQRLYYTTTAKSNINFFKNMLYLDDLNQSPIQSPISTAGILSYKYRLVEKIQRDGKPTLNKIKIEPRNIVTSTLQGYIWVQDSTWLVEKIDLTLEKGNLYIYDYFQVIQDFDVSSDTLCLLVSQEMNYGVDYRKESYDGQTVAKYSNYEFFPDFPKKYFGNELAITTEEAYERDSLYWSDKRMTPLSPEEIDYIKKRDSIENLFTKSSYLDSVDSVFNRVTFWKVVWFGIDHRNREKKTQWTLSSLAATIQPIYIAGPRVGPDFDFFKKWDSERTFDSYSRVDVGLLNGDIKGRTDLRYLYNPFKQASVGVRFVHNYDLIRNFDAATQILLRDNFIESTSGTVFHDFEIFNGLYLESNFRLTQRRPIPEDTKFIRWFDDALDNKEPPEFQKYEAFIADFTLSYTPFQKYMREPKRKVILGSKWPTFYAYYEKGVPQLLGSDINHDYLRLGIRQTFKILTFGTSSYHATSGKFLNAKGLREVDYKYHRRSDPIWFSNPLFSYQDLDTSLPTLNWYFESHFIHHFNGSLTSKIPFMKKTRIGTVAGGGYLWVPEHNWQHYEFFAGLERVFKFSRRRLRIGLYAVFSDGNQISPRNTFKVSFALLDRRNMKFNF
ncbi:MAG: DUF5686 family protein [Brumimicrobium sp.]|nr:DUF5686 family protein [Brumimicrobium sp.]